MRVIHRSKKAASLIVSAMVMLGTLELMAAFSGFQADQRQVDQLPCRAGILSVPALKRDSLRSGCFIYHDSLRGVEFEIKKIPGVNTSAGFSVSKSRNNGLFSISFSDIDSVYAVDDKTILSGKSGVSHGFYNLTNDKFEWELVLRSAPPENCLRYQIETDNLVFYFQPPDTFAAHDKDWQFADDIPGSYAVYANSGGLSAAKAFHIYRPRAWDAAGDTVWCDLDIDPQAKLLAITIPEPFLESARFPVLIDPVFGYSGQGGTGVSMGAQNFRHQVNYNYSQEAVGGMLAAHICCYKINPAAACTAAVVVYSSDSTLAGCNRIAASDKIPVTVTAASPDGAEWLSAAISGTLTDNDKYLVSWQGYETCDYCLRVCADYTGISGAERYYIYNDWGTNENLSGYSSSGYRYSVYVEYEEAAGNGDPFIRLRKIKRGNR